MKILDFLNYEIRSSWWGWMIWWGWGRELTARYFAWKTRHKYRRYIDNSVKSASLELMRSGMVPKPAPWPAPPGTTSAKVSLAELERQLAAERERADYAWRNTNTIEAARQEEMRKREAAEASLATVRHHLTQLATFADQAVGALATIEAESTEEEEKLQAIIDGLQQWAPDALREAITDRWPVPECLRK